MSAKENPENNEPKTNVPEFSVGDLAQSLKRTLEENYGRVRVRGEIGRVTIPGSGHLYTNLKDENATIDAVCWKGALSKLSIKPEEGLDVIVTGRVTSYPASSKYQIIIESMELAGEGALLKMLEERKKKLTAEGLFAAERKRETPFLPEVIGVVTSPTGAVIRDILHRLSDRFPRHVLVWPVLVQGEGAAAQITAAIEGFQSFPVRPDVLIIARGGGSLEDLMPFNEENVVRAVAASSIPVISAIGHETDTTLVDFAADLRAPTPTGAAEMAVPVRTHLIAQVLEDEQRLVSTMERHLSEHRTKIENLARHLGDPAKLLEIKTQSLDHSSDKLSGVFERFLSTKRENLTTIAAALPHPKSLLDNAKLVWERWGEHLASIGTRLMGEAEKSLAHQSQMLEAYSFKNILNRGFSVVYDASGKIISDPNTSKNGDLISILFKADKKLGAVVGGKTPAEKPAKKTSNTKETGQQSLF